ncbi:MAG: M14 family zinc carboxypeptidase [bacterium]
MMLHSLIESSSVRFNSCEEIRKSLIQACEKHADVATFHTLGTSEEGRAIDAVVLGNGTRRISLIAGAHADEPVGPETLRAFILQGLAQRDRLKTLFETFQFIVVPHINPDGEARNQRWIQRWPDFEAYLQHVHRELPGRDLEFGFPRMRRENALVADFLMDHSPFVLHASLHGMGVSEGAMLLIEKHWIERTKTLRVQFANAAQESGLALHDHDRKGEKGFLYITPGFSTTPEGEAMRTFFASQNDAETAQLFHDSSMEYVRKLSRDPLCLVTELPLFVIQKKSQRQQAGVPHSYLEFKNKLPNLKAAVMRGQSITREMQEFQITPIDLKTAMQLQLIAIQLGIDTVK